MESSESQSLPKPPPLDAVTEKWEVPAFGRPGEKPTWAPSGKDGVGAALAGASRCWFTFAGGIITEIFFARPDRPCLRDLRFLVTDGVTFLADEELDTEHAVERPHPNAPLYRIINTCKQGRFRIEKTLLSDPRRDAVMLSVRLVPLIGKLSDYRLFVVLNPHLGNRGGGNSGWVSQYKGRPMLFARRKDPAGGDVAMAVASDARWAARSVGFVGRSDGITDLRQHKHLHWQFNRARRGNVALSGEIDLASCGDGSFRLVLAFDRSAPAAALTCVLSLLDHASVLEGEFVQQWDQWHGELMPLDRTHPWKQDLFRISGTVLRVHRSLHFSGGGVASLSTPWGEARGDKDRNGYHVVWARDLAQAAGALLAAGAKEDARRALSYLWAVQEADGHWAQDLWMDGRSSAPGIQLDEAAQAILLVDLAHRNHAWDGEQKDLTIRRFWPMTRAAAIYLCRNGPWTQEDRWENESGYTTFTLATGVAALALAAIHAQVVGETELGECFSETADLWNASIESWTYVTNTALSRRVGVEGYYVRIAPDELANRRDGLKHLHSAHHARAVEVACVDALSLVRYGLRRADDPHIFSTLRVIDAVLKADTPRGACWRRFSFDTYGEHDDGAPPVQDGANTDPAGHGRAWPLLTGERGHFELIAGRATEAEKLLDTMAALASDSGMLPEQVWDAAAIPERKLFPGRPSGSAMPLAWAHGEYIKLRRSLVDGQCFDRPVEVVRRYAEGSTYSPFALWQMEHQPVAVVPGKQLRVELKSPAVVRFGTDRRATVSELATHPTAVGLHRVDLPTQGLPAGHQFKFSITQPGQRAGTKGTEFVVTVDPAAAVLPGDGGS